MDTKHWAASISKLVKELAGAKCPGDVPEWQAVARMLCGNSMYAMQDLACVEAADLNGLRALRHECAQFVQMQITMQNNKRKLFYQSCEENAKRIKANDVPSARVASGEGVAAMLKGMQMCVVDNVTQGPSAACRDVAESFTSDWHRKLWLEQARVESLCNSTARSTGSTRSALSCWMTFARSCVGVSPGAELPPSLDGLIAWGRLFRNKGTYGNYVSRLRLACEIAGVSTCVFDSPAIARAKRGIQAVAAAPRPKRFIDFEILQKLVRSATQEKDHVQACLYSLCYAFLLRVPSEGLPMVMGRLRAVGEDRPPLCGTHFDLSIAGSTITSSLARRKNKPHGSTLMRQC